MIYVKGAPNAWHTTVPPQVLVLSFPFKKKGGGVNATQLLKVRFLYINAVNVLQKVLFYQSLLLTYLFHNPLKPATTPGITASKILLREKKIF